jgi:hypothetical protein
MESRTAAVVATVLAIVSWLTLFLQLWLTVRNVMIDGHDVMFGFVRYYSYFTVLTNTLAAVVLTSAITPSNKYSWWSSPGVRGATTGYMAMVGIFYTLILREAWDPRGLQKLADVVLHDVMPVAFVAHWLIFWRTDTLRVSSVPAWLIYPLAYLGYCMAYGAVMDWYPYPFINARTIGYSRILVNALGITAAFAALSLVVVALDRVLPGPAGGWAKPPLMPAGRSQELVSRESGAEPH